MYEILLIVYLLIALFLIFLILIQQGKGADMGASFGAGSSNTLFGASGSGSFLTKLTQGLAVGFFVLSLILGKMTNDQVKQPDTFENIGMQQNGTSASASDIPTSDIPASDIPSSSDLTRSDVPASTTQAGTTEENPATEGDK